MTAIGFHHPLGAGGAFPDRVLLAAIQGPGRPFVWEFSSPKSPRVVVVHVLSDSIWVVASRIIPASMSQSRLVRPGPKLGDALLLGVAITIMVGSSLYSGAITSAGHGAARSEVLLRTSRSSTSAQDADELSSAEKSLADGAEPTAGVSLRCTMTTGGALESCGPSDNETWGSLGSSAAPTNTV